MHPVIGREAYSYAGEYVNMVVKSKYLAVHGAITQARI